jgi:hypothetical protein
MTNGFAAPPARWNPGHVMPQAPDMLAPDTGLVEPVSEPLLTRLDRLIGILERHPQAHDKAVTLEFASPAGLVTGNTLAYDGSSPRLSSSGIEAQTFIVDNPSGYILREMNSRRWIPQTTFNYLLTLLPSQHNIELRVFGGSDLTATTITVVATERVYFKW